MHVLVGARGQPQGLFLRSPHSSCFYRQSFTGLDLPVSVSRSPALQSRNHKAAFPCPPPPPPQHGFWRLNSSTQTCILQSTLLSYLQPVSSSSSFFFSVSSVLGTESRSSVIRMLNGWGPPWLFKFVSVFVAVLRFWPWYLVYARWALYQLCHIPSPTGFCFF